MVAMTADTRNQVSLRPADFCRYLVAALGASDGRRRKRKRTTTPDAIGMSVKRDLLDRAIADDPEADAFEAWLFERVLAAGIASGPVRAMAIEILDEWRVALLAPDFRDWLERGAPSDDASEG
jgi:hypothetical protein